MDGQQVADILRESRAAKAAAELAADQAQTLMIDSVPPYVQQRALANYVSACALLSRELDRAERLARSKKEPSEAPEG